MVFFFEREGMMGVIFKKSSVNVRWEVRRHREVISHCTSLEC